MYLLFLLLSLAPVELSTIRRARRDLVVGLVSGHCGELGLLMAWRGLLG